MQLLQAIDGLCDYFPALLIKGRILQFESDLVLFCFQHFDPRG